MAVCLGVVPDTYFIDYDTKRDYQTENGITKRSKKVASKQGLNFFCSAIPINTGTSHIGSRISLVFFSVCIS